MSTDEDLTEQIKFLMQKARDFGAAAEVKFQQVIDMIEDFFGKGDDDGTA